MKLLQKSLLRAISLSTICIIILLIISYFVLPQYLFVVPGSEVTTSGIVDHKKIGQAYTNGQPSETFTASVRLLEDDPVNKVKSGETIAYTIPKNQWEELEWGDTVRIKLLPSLKAEITELYPSVKPPEWSTQYQSAFTINVQADKPIYETGETAHINVTIRNVFQNQSTESVPIQLTIFKSNVFWVFENGKVILSNANDYTTEQVTIQPNQEYSYSLQLEINQFDQNNSNSIYYIRTYIGYFTENPENTLLGTTIIGVEN